MASLSPLHARQRVGSVLVLLLGLFLLPFAHAQTLNLLNLGGAAGSVIQVGTQGFDLTASGRGPAVTTDQLSFVQTPRTGDFDLQVRVDELGISNPWVRAGLMIRTGPETNAPFAAVFASSPLAGCFFESRSSVGGNPTRASSLGGFPAIQPDLWLRLKREGNTVTGYASTDARTWTRLGFANLNLPEQPRVGLAVSSQNPAFSTVARLRSFGPTQSTAESPWRHAREAAHPSSRRTGLVFSEIHYAPGATTNGTPGIPFIEVANHGDLFQDLTGWSLTGGIQYRFPQGFRLEAGALAVIAAEPATLQQQSGLSQVLGPWTGEMNLTGDTLELRDALGAIKLQVTYAPDAPWPVAAAGTGHSLVLLAPSFGEADPRAWGPSQFRGGSPGRRDPAHAHPAEAVVINEYLANTAGTGLDFIEIHNRSPQEVDVSGYILTDSIATNRFRIPASTRIGSGAHLAWNETELGFGLKAAGETLLLLSPDGRRVLDIVRFNDQEEGVSSGRFPDGSDRFHRLSSPSPGATNPERRAEDVVISEIFYNPPTGDADEFVELHHRGTNLIDLTGWRLRGGIQFDFPAGSRLEPGQQVVIAKDPARLLSHHPMLPTARVAGPYLGQLGDGGDMIRLSRPIEERTTNTFGVVTTEILHIGVGEVRYVDGGAWGQWSDGGGSSLELMDPDADPSLAANWSDSDETRKAEWTSIEWSGRLDNGDATYGLNRLFLGLLNDGECQVDDIQLIRAGSTNLLRNGTFEDGNLNWTLSGNHAGSTIVPSAARNGTRGLHLRAQGGLDTGVNSVRGTLFNGLANGQSVTLRANVRWVAGWPELLFRVRGNFADYAAPLPVPQNLGTPGRPNSRLLTNAGPAIFEVAHFPVLPRSGEEVLITARASDPDGIASLICRYRVDPSTVLAEVPLRDDGLVGDAVAGDGVYTGRLPAQSSSALMAYTLLATDAADATSIWPRTAPLNEGLVRWNEPVPTGSFPHVHLWTTVANRSAAGGNALNNAYRRGTLVYGNTRVIHNVLFRDKGSPYHSGSGDLTARTPDDDLLHGVSERLFSRTGNGGVEDTALRGRVSNWIASQMGIPSLSGKYQLFYVNGSSFANVVEDLEEPDHRYAQQHYPEGGEGDLFKISIWFEFGDDNRAFNSTQATLERFLSENRLKLARYRWNWERRAQQFPESDYTTILDLVSVVNSTADAGYAARVSQQADVNQWMRVFAFHRVTGNWDSWTYNVGQNMYIYRQPGRPAVLFPWDIDFTLGLGDGPTASLWGGQDPVANTRIYDHPAFRRMLWRALLQAAEGPMLPQNFGPVIEGYRAIQQQNNLTGLASISPVTNYINSRRTHILSRYRAADTATFAITSNGGNDFTANAALVTLTGTAPFRVADLAVNGARYPVTWTGFTTFSVAIPLTAAVNVLQVVGLDANGKPLPDSDSIRISFPGAIPEARDWVGIHEIHYHPAEPGTSFVELHNRHPSISFNLAGFRLDGVGYVFPDNAVISPSGFLVLAADRAAFAARFGASTPLFDEFPGGLDDDGERLRLTPPGSDLSFSAVRYLNRAPWPADANGRGPSLQRIDAALDSRRPANWAVTATNAPNRVTPGAVNATRNSLPPFPEVWINEVFPIPPTGITDNAGDAAPFVELHNPGTAVADLSGLWLSDSLESPTRWAFPNGTTMSPGGFLRIWLDNQPDQSVPGHLHASFTLPAGTGQIVVSRLQGSPAAPAVLDWLEYQGLPTGRGLGSIPDGDPYSRRQLYVATPGAANDPAVPAVEVVINEVLARNTSTLADPADGDFDDWIELYNPASTPADLSGYFLTDNLTNRTASVLPPGTLIPAGGFLLVWTDDEPQQTRVSNGWFHTSFSLSLNGEQIGLFAPDGSAVDTFTFGPQVADVSVGRFPDGPGSDWIVMPAPTPAAPNTVPGGNLPPRFAALPPQFIPEGVPWSIRLQATDPDPGQSVRFSLGTDAPAGVDLNAVTGDLSWTPDEIHGPGTYRFTVRATDSGTPNRSANLLVQVNVTEANLAPVLGILPEATLGEGALLTLEITATDPDLPRQTLSYSLGTNAPKGMAINPDTGLITWIPLEDQGPASYEVSVIVTDSAFPPGIDSRTVRITVDEVDNPPVIAQPGGQFVQEGNLLEMTLKASDPDGAPIRYALQSEPPAGLTLDPLTGVIRWVPAEEQGPGSYPILVQVTEQSPLAQTAQVTFSILVEEANQPPSLPDLAPLTRFEGDVLELNVAATDPDRPAQEFTYSLEVPAPPGAVLDPRSGDLRWTLPADSGPVVYTARIRVADDQFPPGIATTSFTVTVQPRFRVVLSEIMNRPAQAGAHYIEILNPSAFNSWDLSGVRLTGRNLGFTFPQAFVLRPRQVVCVAANATAFTAAYGANILLSGTWSGALGFDGDDLQLRSADGTLLDRVQFASSPPWPPQSPTGGPALQLIDPFADNSRPGNWTLSVPWGGPRQVLTLNSDWRFFTAGAPAAGWNEVAFDDTSWNSGAGLFYVESATLPGPKSTPLNLGQWSYYFRSQFVLSNLPSSPALLLSHVIDDGAVFHLNGSELTRFNFNAGTVVGPATPAAATVGDAVSVGPINLPANLLRPGTNVLAVQVHQSALSSSDIVFGAALLVDGTSLPGLSPGRPNDISAVVSEFPRIHLNEVQPVAGTFRDAQGDAEPWLELLNSGGASIDLTGWTLSASGAAAVWTFPKGSRLLPGERRMVVLDAEPNETTASEWHTSFQPSPTTGWLALARPAAVGSGIVDALAYTNLPVDRSWAAQPEGQSFRYQGSLPTPGTPNPVVVLPSPLLSARWNGDPLVIRWDTVADAGYRLLGSESPFGPWIPIGYFDGTGAPVEATESVANGPFRFYRVTVEAR